MKKALLLMLLVCLNLQARYLPLPVSLQNKSVYYVQSQQLPYGWSCGYNALFNACNLERYLGRSNLFSDWNLFSKACLTYLQKVRVSPQAASTNKMLDDLAGSLRLQKSQYLSLNHRGEVEPLVSGPVSITYRAGLPKVYVQAMLANAKKQREQKAIASIKQYLTNQRGKLAFAHFFCRVVSHGQGHAILVSLVQFASGERMLFVFDNTNDKITNSSQIKRHIDYLCAHFGVSQKRNATITIPSRWR